MMSRLFWEWSYAVSSQPPHGGETLDLTATSSMQAQYAPLHQQPRTYYHTYYDNMLSQQHDSYQQQRQQLMAPRMPSGCAENSTAFTAPTNIMWQTSPDFAAMRYNEADYDGSHYQQQRPLMALRMPSDHAQRVLFATAPMNDHMMPSGNWGMTALNLTPNNGAHHHQQQQAIGSRRSPGHLQQHAPVIPPHQQQPSPMMPRRPQRYTQDLPLAPASTPIPRQLPTPSILTPKISQQGLKRSADDSTRMPAAKRRATVILHGMRMSNLNQSPQNQLPKNEMAVIKTQLFEIKEKHGDEAYLRAAAELRQAWQARNASLKPNKDRVANAERVEQEKAAELRRVEQEKVDAARVEWQKANMLIRRRQAQQAILDAEKRQREEAEKLRVAQEERLEHERKAIRREQLRTDPATLYRNYYEYLEYFPVEQGEPRNQYCMSLLANRRLFNAQPGEDSYEAIMYAKDNWEMFLSNKDYDMALGLATTKTARLVADVPTSIAGSKAAKR